MSTGSRLDQAVGTALEERAAPDHSASECTSRQPQRTDAKCGRNALQRLLQERTKELACLHGMAKVIDECPRSRGEILQRVVELLPDAWQYSESACARILVEHESFVTAGFIQSPWVQAAGILVDGTRVGAVEVYYLRKMPDADEGPFLRDERFLIDTVAGRLGRVCERIAAEEQVRSERTALKNMNLVLREVMVNLEEGKREVKTSIQANVARIIMPLLNDLETALPQGLKGYAALLRNNLEDVTSAFADTLARDCTSLSPTEVRVCKMISQGLSSKEIAQLRCVSTATVARQRESIRRKLGVARSNVNLASYLSNFSGPRAPITSSAARVTKNPDR